MQTRVIRIDPRRLKLLEVNARYMRHETFMRLVENVRRDGVLTSAPFCAIWKYERADDPIPRHEDTGDPIYEVLSGNHRVQAAVAADLAEIEVMVTDDPLRPDQRKAIQLSHNSITGEDDPALLKTIYTSIVDTDLRFYSGLDDKTLQLLDKVTPVSIGERGLQFQAVSLVFLPTEAKLAEDTLALIKHETASAKRRWIARWEDYDAYMDQMERVHAAYDIKNVATALMILLEIASRHLGDLREGYLDEDGEPIQKGQHVPLSTVLETERLPASVAARLNKLIGKLLADKKLDKRKRWQVLEKLLDTYDRNGLVN
jgi:hypothetical protein